MFGPPKTNLKYTRMYYQTRGYPIFISHQIPIYYTQIQHFSQVNSHGFHVMFHSPWLPCCHGRGKVLFVKMADMAKSARTPPLPPMPGRFGVSDAPAPPVSFFTPAPPVSWKTGRRFRRFSWRKIYEIGVSYHVMVFPWGICEKQLMFFLDNNINIGV